MHVPYDTILLEDWEEVYKRSQVSLWILLSLKDAPKYMAQIQAFIKEHYPAMQVDNKSMYRTLRRLTENEIVSYTLQASRKGPDRKIYGLSELGDRVLQKFLSRNISTVFYGTSVQRLILESCEQ